MFNINKTQSLSLWFTAGKLSDIVYLIRFDYLCKNNKDKEMRTSVILRFVILGLLWLGLVSYIIARTPKFTLYTAFVIVASAIIIFVPIYKKYVKNVND